MVPHFLLLPFFLLATLSACAGGVGTSGQTASPPQVKPEPSPEDALRVRATQFWEARIKGDLVTQYGLLEPGARERMTLTGFVRSRGSIIFSAYEFEGIEVVGNQGRVKTKATFRMNTPQLSRFGPWTQPASTLWVREGGVWYLKGSQEDVDKPMKAEEG
jgi:hypothetical protein